MKRCSGGFAFPSWYSEDIPGNLEQLQEEGESVFKQILPTLTKMQQKSISFSISRNHPPLKQIHLLFGLLWYIESSKERIYELKSRITDVYRERSMPMEEYKRFAMQCRDEMKKIKDAMSATKYHVFSNDRTGVLQNTFRKISKWIRKPEYTPAEREIFEEQNKDRYVPFAKSQALNILGVRSGFSSPDTLGRARKRAKISRETEGMKAWLDFLRRGKRHKEPAPEEQRSETFEEFFQSMRKDPILSKSLIPPPLPPVPPSSLPDSALIGATSRPSSFQPRPKTGGNTTWYQILNPRKFLELIISLIKKRKDFDVTASKYRIDLLVQNETMKDLQTTLGPRSEVFKAVEYSLGMANPEELSPAKAEIVDLFEQMGLLPNTLDDFLQIFEDMAHGTEEEYLQSREVISTVWNIIRKYLPRITKARGTPVFSGFGKF